MVPAGFVTGEEEEEEEEGRTSVISDMASKRSREEEQEQEQEEEDVVDYDFLKLKIVHKMCGGKEVTLRLTSWVQATCTCKLDTCCLGTWVDAPHTQIIHI